MIVEPLARSNGGRRRLTRTGFVPDQFGRVTHPVVGEREAAVLTHRVAQRIDRGGKAAIADMLLRGEVWSIASRARPKPMGRANASHGDTNRGRRSGLSAPTTRTSPRYA